MVLLREAEDSRLSPREHRGPFQNGDTEAFVMRAAQGVWNDCSVGGTQVESRLTWRRRAAPRMDGWARGVGGGCEGNGEPHGHPEPFRTPFSSFLGFPREGNVARAVAATLFIRPATPTPLQHRQGFGKMLLLVLGEWKGLEAEHCGRRPRAGRRGLTGLPLPETRRPRQRFRTGPAPVPRSPAVSFLCRPQSRSLSLPSGVVSQGQRAGTPVSVPSETTLI